MRRAYILIFACLLMAVWCVCCETGNAKDEKSTKDEAIEKCVELCKDAKVKGQDLSKGPCLSDDNPKWDIADWVCDVAHWPRQDVDNDPANQCKDFRLGKANHFVEVDPSCEFIRAM